MRKRQLLTKLNGYSLIEVLIVISIIALIIITGFFMAKSQYLKGRDARRKTDLYKIKEAVEEYEKDHDCYPDPSLVNNCDPGEGLKPYLTKIPCDPTTGSFYYYEDDGRSCSGWYLLYAFLENQNDPAIIEGLGLNGLYNYYLGSSNAPQPSPGPVSQPTAAPTPIPGGECGGLNYWGCIDGTVCQEVQCNIQGTGPVCQPGYSSLQVCQQQCPGIPCLP